MSSRLYLPPPVLLVFFALLVVARGAPIPINNASFERPVLSSGDWTNALPDPDLVGNGPDWLGQAGSSNGNTFIEYIPGFSSQGNQHLGMQNNYYVFQNTGVPWTANTTYTLTVGVGNRNEPAGALAIIGLTSSTQIPGPTNTLPYANANDALANDSVLAVASRTVDLGLQNSLSFSNYTVTFVTDANPPTGNVVIFLGDEGTASRAHFDHVRLTSESGLARLSNAPATNVTANGATLHGTVEDVGDGAPSVTLYYGTADRGTDPLAWDASVSLPGTQSGNYASIVTGLTPATVYFFSSRGINSAGTGWASAAQSFETDPLPPTVSNIAPTDIGATMANPGVEVTDDGGDLPQATLYYGRSDGGEVAGNWEASISLGSLSGAQAASLTGLSQNTTFYYRAYASNDGGDAWASTSGSFMTTVVTLPGIENRSAQSIGGTSASCRGEVTDTGGDAPAVTLYYGPADGQTDPSAWAHAVFLGTRSGDFSQFISGLVPETDYYYRLFASNGAGTVWTSAAETFTTTALVPNGVVINELHYNPGSNTSAEEFVELHNPGDTPINISGWRLNRAVDYTFPLGTEVPAQGYLVVAEDPAHLQTVYGVTALGPYSGGLSGKGEDIELEDASGNRQDFVDYGVGFPWPTSSDGAGSSMELVHSTLDNDLGGSWRASGTVTEPAEPQILIPTGDTGWRYRRTTSEASSPVDAWRQVGFVEDGTWMTGQTVIGYGDGDDATVIDNMRNTHWGLYLRKTFTVDPLQIPTQLQLNVYIDDGCIVWLNGVEVARLYVNAGAKTFNGMAMDHEAAWETVLIPNAGAILGGGTNVLAIHGMNSTLGSSDFSIDAELRTPEAGALAGDPTPGAVNSVFVENAPPQIRQVAHFPEQPTAAEEVVITAKITDPDGVGPVTLTYQMVDPGAYVRRSDAAYETTWTSVPMRDDGTAGDAIAGDSVYSLTMSSNLHEHRRLVRYRIHGEDSLGNAVTVPYADDESPNFAYYVYDGVPAWTGADRPGVTAPATFPATLMESMPVYQLIANATDVTNSQYNGSSDGVHMFGTMIYEGKVYDHITFENRGEASTYQSGKNKWRFRFNRTRDFEARDQWGQKYESPWDELNFDACASPWAPLHRGMAGLDEAISYRLFALAGMASPRLHYVHFRVVDAVEEAPADQYAGDLWGLYTAIEQPDGSFLDDRNLPDGNVYKIESNNGDKKHQGATQPTDSSDWNTFRGSSGSTQTEAYWRANMNLADYYTFRGCNRILGNVDVRHGFNHYFYHHPNGLWQVMPWDLDMMFIAETHWPGVIQQEACLNIPALNIEFKNRCRELLDLICSDASDDGGQIGQLIDEYADIVNPSGHAMTWSDIDQYMWNYHPRTRGSVGNASGQGNHKGNFFASPFQDSRFGGQWTRTLVSQDHEGSVEYIRNYTTDTFTGGTWAPGNGNQNGYGYEFLAQEASDASIPSKPTIAHIGSSFATNDLTFSTTTFADPQGAGTFAAISWRVAEIANPSTPGFDPTSPRKYEIETVWESSELTPFAATFTLPPVEVREGRTYRVRARHKDTSGRWSHWSEAVQFVAAAPDLTVWQDNLMITELMYHPAPASANEIALGYSDSDFEFIELQNISPSRTLDLTELRFTKGVDFDFVGGAITSLAPGEFVLVVRNVAAFESRHGLGLPVAGAYDPDKLSNGGEQVKLAFGAGSAIHDFTYDDKYPWPTAPDGLGYSLKLINSESAPDHALATSWTGSTTLGGTPGTGELPAFEIWQAANFTAAQLLDPRISGPQADPDHDGYPNIVEFGAGADPNLGGNVPDIEPTAAQDGLILTRPRGNSGVVWTLELSDALGSWYYNGDGSGQIYTQAPVTVDLGNGQETLTIQNVLTANERERHFFRIRARLVE